MNLMNLIKAILLISIVTSSSSESYIKWPTDFVNCLRNHSHFNTIIFITTDNIDSYMEQMQELILQISQHYPTYTLHLNQQSYEVFQYFLTLYVPTFSLIIYPKTVTNKTKVNDLSTDIRELYSAFNLYRDAPNFILLVFRMRSEALKVVTEAFKIVHRSKGDRILRLLKMLEITITNKNSTIRIQRPKSRGVARLHSYNGLRNAMKYIPEVTEIFPKMIKNLNRRRIKLSLQPAFPVLNATINRKGCIVPNSMTGPHGLILNTIAESSNFTWDIYHNYQGTVKPTYNKNCLVTMAFSELATGTIDVSANFHRLPYIRNWSVIDTDFERYTKMIHIAYMRHQEPIVALVPILHAEDIKLSRNFGTLFLATVLIGFLLKIIVRMMNFDPKFWTAENIWYVIFGISVPCHTKSIAERLVLTSILIISIAYSMSVMDQLLDVQMDLFSEIRLSTWKDLTKAKLTLMLDYYERQILMDTDNPLLQRHAEKAILPKKIIQKYVVSSNSTYNRTANFTFMENIEKTCVDNIVLKYHKNVSCVVNSVAAERHIQLTKLATGEETLITLKESAFELWLGIALTHETKYAARFEQVMQYLTEAGLIEKWHKTEILYTRTEIIALNKLDKDKEHKRANVMMQLLPIAILGYVLSILVLVGELTVLRLRNKIVSSNICNIFDFQRIRKVFRYKHYGHQGWM